LKLKRDKDKKKKSNWFKWQKQNGVIGLSKKTNRTKSKQLKNGISESSLSLIKLLQRKEFSKVKINMYKICSM